MDTTGTVAGVNHREGAVTCCETVVPERQQLTSLFSSFVWTVDCTHVTVAISSLPCLRLTNFSTKLVACGSTIHGRVPSHHNVLCAIYKLMP